MTESERKRREDFAAKAPNLRARAKIQAAFRRYFDGLDFMEVDTPCLQNSPGMEPHIMALPVVLGEPLEQGRRTLYLHTSPEFAMKKILAAGLERIYQFAHVWRDEERSPLHHPEFVMLEWYRAHQTYETLMEDCAALMRIAAKTADVRLFEHNGRRCDPFAPPRRLSVPDAFHQQCGVDLLATAPNPLEPDAALLAAEARRIGLYASETDSWEDVFFRIMLERIEPGLGDEEPTILMDYPLSMAALSRPKPEDPRLAERFELYACGVELANAFGELTDASEQRRRFKADMDLKQRLYGVRYPIDEGLLGAMEGGMPPSAGAALGFDRLVMLATGADCLDQVLWESLPKAGPDPS